MGIEHYDDGTISAVPDRMPASLFGCLWCLSIWMAPVVYIIWLYAPIAVWLLALSAGAIMVDCLMERRKNG